MQARPPRLLPLQPDEWDDTAKQVLEPLARFRGGEVLNIFGTLAHHPELMKRWLVFGNHVLGKSTLPAREREIVILRIGWLCQAEYEWGQHVVIGREAGLSDAEIAAIAAGPDAEGWSDDDATLLRAVDELHADACIHDDTWAALAARWSTQQCLDLVFAIGQYNLVSMALNTLGVERDDGVPGFAETAGGAAPPPRR